MAKTKTIKEAPRNLETLGYRAVLAFSNSCNVQVVINPLLNTAEITVNDYETGKQYDGTATLEEVR